MSEQQHILIVDDVLSNILVLKNILIKKGYKVSSVQSGKDTLSFVKNQQPDLILLDVMMPDMDGYEVCKRLKNSAFAKVPIIFVTAKFDELDIKYGYTVGGEDYIRKPILKEELLARVKIILEKNQFLSSLQTMNDVLEQIVEKRTKELHLILDIVKMVPQQYSIKKFCNKLVDTLQKSFANTNWGVLLQYNNEKYKSTSFNKDKIILTKIFYINDKTENKLIISGENYSVSEEKAISNLLEVLLIEIKQILSYKEILKTEKENKEFITSILNGTPDGIVVLDNNLQIINFNPAFCEIFKIDEKKLLGSKINLIFNPEKIKNFDNNIFSEIDKHGKVYFELDSLKLSEGILHCSITGAPRIKNDKKNGYLLVCKDIGIRVDLEAKLMSANKMEAIGQLAAGIAHEINSPTQFIRNNVEFINETIQNLIEFSKKLNNTIIKSDKNLNSYKEELLTDIDNLDLDFINEETQAAVNESLEGIDRITKIVNAMRTFSHPGNEEKNEIEISDLIKKAIIVSRNEWKYDAIIETEFNLDRLVPAFRHKLSQVILNLIINSAHAIHDRNYNELGSIKISTHEIDNNIAEIRIQDNGIGINKDIRDKIFEPFFTTKKIGVGTGQGLAMIYNIIVKNHDGQIDFESEVGVGTTFIIKLPLYKIIDMD